MNWKPLVEIQNLSNPTHLLVKSASTANIDKLSIGGSSLKSKHNKKQRSLASRLNQSSSTEASDTEVENLCCNESSSGLSLNDDSKLIEEQYLDECGLSTQSSIEVFHDDGEIDCIDDASETMMANTSDNCLSSDQLESIFKDASNLIEIEYQYQKLSRSCFMKLMVVTESFNRLLTRLYNLNAAHTIIEDFGYVQKVNLNLLIRSLVISGRCGENASKSKKESNYFVGLLKTLIQIIFARKHAITDAKLFNLDFKDLILNDKNQNISLLDKCFMIVKLFNQISIEPLAQDHKELAHVLINTTNPGTTNFTDDLEIKLNKSNSLSDLDEDTKLDLLIRLINIIFCDLDLYRNELDELEGQIIEAKANLKERVKDKDNFEMKNEIYDLKHVDVNEEDLTNANIALNLEKDIKDANKTIKRLTENLEFLSKIAPFSKVYLTDKNCVLNFWSFDSLANCLIIEKQSFFSIDSPISSSNQVQDINLTNSECYLINDFQQLTDMLHVFNLNLIDSNLTNMILSKIDLITSLSGSNNSQFDENNNVAPLKSVRLTETFFFEQR